jgi:hypothetical protein
MNTLTTKLMVSPPPGHDRGPIGSGEAPRPDGWLAYLVLRSGEDRVRAVVDDVLGKTAEDWLRTEGVS